tara:strand:- start:169 stop:411 length:243 start_codon:yes stop_codon:yes gene_type:complete
LSTTEFDIMVDELSIEAFEILEEDDVSLTEEEFVKNLKEKLSVHDHLAETLYGAWQISKGKKEPYAEMEEILYPTIKVTT